MIHTIIFVFTLCAIFVYGLVVKLEKPAPRAAVQAPVAKVVVVAKEPVVETGVHEEPVAAVVDIEKGHKLFQIHCISCHNKDPNMKGAIGPELIDAPLDLMKIKVVTGRYPEVLPKGFVPKRKTKQMKKFPKLEADVPSIHAWIQSVKKK